MSSNRLYCDITQGVNTCKICFNECYYSIKIPQNKHKKYNNMILFRCGHGTCNDCYNNFKHNFKCPFCRNDSVNVMEHFGSQSIKCTMNTLDEFLSEWSNFLERAMKSNHIFAQLHRQIYNDYIIKIQNKKVLDAKIKKEKDDLAKKTQKRIDRENAICKYCGKDTFTSSKQLQVHINKKHRK